MRIYLSRHGETEYNINGIIMGHLPTPINKKGKKQAHILANEMKKKGIQKIYSSDLKRAQQTAEIISLVLNLPIIYSSKLREHTLGDLDGVSISDLLDEMVSLQEFDNLMIKHNGEITKEFMKRVWDGFVQIVKENEKLDTILIITHGGPIRSIISKILDASELIFDNLKQDNCCINIIDYTKTDEEELFSIALVNDVCHLS